MSTRRDRPAEVPGQLTVTRPRRHPGAGRPPLHPGPAPAGPWPSAPRSAPWPTPPTIRRPASPPRQRPAQACEARPVAVRALAARPSRAQVESRRRTVALVLVAPVTLAIVVLLGQLADAVRAASVPEQTVAVRVAEGESLWQIARRAAPQADPGTVVQRIIAENGLESAAVSPGQVVKVPTG